MITVNYQNLDLPFSSTNWENIINLENIRYFHKDILKLALQVMQPENLMKMYGLLSNTFIETICGARSSFLNSKAVSSIAETLTALFEVMDSRKQEILNKIDKIAEISSEYELGAVIRSLPKYARKEEIRQFFILDGFKNYHLELLKLQDSKGTFDREILLSSVFSKTHYYYFLVNSSDQVVEDFDSIKRGNKYMEKRYHVISSAFQMGLVSEEICSRAITNLSKQYRKAVCVMSLERMSILRSLMSLSDKDLNEKSFLSKSELKETYRLIRQVAFYNSCCLDYWDITILQRNVVKEDLGILMPILATLEQSYVRTKLQEIVRDMLGKK
jgi:hypothetical protein